MLDDQFKQQERQIDRDNQVRVLQKLCAFKGSNFSFTQTSTTSVFDAFIEQSGERVAIAEVKCRTCTFAAFEREGYRIDKHKILRLVQTAKGYGVPAILVVRWKCGTQAYINLTAELSDKPYPFPSKLVKRGDRDELPDLQSDIPMSKFVKF